MNEKSGTDARPFIDLRDSGLLWLINRVVFHPRGFALALLVRNGEAVGWELLGDGEEVWTMGDGINEEALFAKVQNLLKTAGPTPR